MITLVLFLSAFALLNRCRGSRWYDMLDSTALGRWLAVLGMGVLAAAVADVDGWRQRSAVALWTTLSLFFWCVWAWNNYWSAAIGNPTDTRLKAFAPVDWVMKKLYRSPPTTDSGLRVWGLIAMTLRQSLAAVCIVGLACLTGHPERSVYALGTLLLGLPYFVFGYLYRREPILWAEYTGGATLGLLVYMAVR